MKRQNTTLVLQKCNLLESQSQEIILFFDHTGTIVDCNQKALDELGFEEDIYQVSISDIFRKAFKYDGNQLSINGRYQLRTAETVAYRKNQTCFPVSLKVAIEESKKGYLGLCTAVNLSNKKELASDLKHIKNDLKLYKQNRNEFVANITHELRTPVNGIMGLTEGLMETELMPKQLETVNLIHRCCINMNAIINDLLDYTKIANNKLVLEQREFNFRKFIDGIVTININKISEKGLKLLVNIANDIPDLVIGDEFRLAQVLNNLFSNAIKFTEVGQIVLEVVKTAHTDDEVELFFMVMDTGIGISEEEKDKLFISFSQVDGSITRRFGGTGLGLSISKMLVEAMHGSIKVESEKYRGSTFSFSVRLGISDTDVDVNEWATDSSASRAESSRNTSKEDDYIFSPEIEYISKMLDDTNIDTKNDIGDTSNSNFVCQEHHEILQDLISIIERLTLCIEMESWEKAEELAESIKNMIPKDHKELSRNAFRLVLSVRKENHETSLTILAEIKEVISGVIGWSK